MDLLPAELLVKIVDFIDPRDSPTLVNLSTYDPNLARIVEPRLFITDAAKANTMHLACSTGNVHLIRTAVEQYDVNPGSYDPRLLYPEPHFDHYYQHRRSDNEPIQLKMSTLQTAARAGQWKAVRVLLGYGHAVTFPPCTAMRNFARSFISPTSLEFVHALLDCPWGQKFIDFHLWPKWVTLNDAGLSGSALVHALPDCPWGQKFIDIHSWPKRFTLTYVGFSESALCKAINLGMPVEVIRRMLEHTPSLRYTDRDSPTRLSRVGRFSEQKSPMVLALGSNSPKPLLRLLIQKGASIEGYIVPSLCKRPIKRLRPRYSKNLRIHSSATIPIYAAAEYFATTGSAEFLDLCLSLGADINQEVPAIVKCGMKSKSILSESCNPQRKPRYVKKRDVKAIKLTPLLVYLLSVRWFSPARMISPIAGIEAFLKRGAQLTPAHMEVVDGQTSNANKYTYSAINGLVKVVSPADLLLDVMGSMAMGHGPLYDTVSFLVNHGCELPENADCSAAYIAREVRKTHMDGLYKLIRKRQYLSAEKLLLNEEYDYSSEAPDHRNLSLLHWCFVARDPDSDKRLPKLDDDLKRAREQLVRTLVSLKAKASDKARYPVFPWNGTPLVFAAMAEESKCMQIIMGSGYLNEIHKQPVNKRHELRDRAKAIAILLADELHIDQGITSTYFKSLPWQVVAMTERRLNVCDGKNSGKWQKCCPLALALQLAKKRGYCVLLHHILSMPFGQHLQPIVHAHVCRSLAPRYLPRLSQKLGDYRKVPEILANFIPQRPYHPDTKKMFSIEGLLLDVCHCY